MTKWITKQNITILNSVLLGVFIITLVAVAVPFIKKEANLPLFASDRRPTPRMTPPPKEEEMYACPRHPEGKSTSPGKCVQCGEELKKVDKYAVIGDRDLFNAHLIVVKIPDPPPVQPLNWQYVGPYKIGEKLLAIIRDRSKNTEYTVREGEEVPGYFGVTVTSISLESVKFMRAGVGEEELKVGQTPSPGGPGQFKDQWADAIRPVVAGHTYTVKVELLAQRIASPEAYVMSLGLEQNMEGSRPEGLKIALLPKENFLAVAGLMQGDIVKSINGSAITDLTSALAYLKAAGSGPSIELEILRGRTPRKLVYTLVRTRKGAE